MEKFESILKDILGDSFNSFISAIERPPLKAIRVNTLKISTEDFKALSPFELSQADFCKDGFIINLEKPGKHPYHHAGLYYVQEPSAMATVSSIADFVGNKVLDMCASPGGKSTQIASLLDENSVFISNEIIQSRANILASNIERMGIKNCLVTNNTPKEIAAAFPSYFETIIVDAPCSGEGMFRKNSDAKYEWSIEHVQTCADRQYEILCSADKALQLGGHIVYSTCTYNKYENEEVLDRFLSNHDYTLLPISKELKAHATDGLPPFNSAMRIFPHLSNGEGHFVALLRKNSGECSEIKYDMPLFPVPKELEKELKLLEERFEIPEHFTYRMHCDKIYKINNLPYAKQLKIIKCGITVAEIAKNRLTPHHNLATVMHKNFENEFICNFSSYDDQIQKYLKGETIPSSSVFSGYGTVKVDGFPLSITKNVDGTLKNHYPKGLRNL